MRAILLLCTLLIYPLSFAEVTGGGLSPQPLGPAQEFKPAGDDSAKEEWRTDKWFIKHRAHSQLRLILSQIDPKDIEVVEAARKTLWYKIKSSEVYKKVDFFDVEVKSHYCGQKPVYNKGHFCRKYLHMKKEFLNWTVEIRDDGPIYNTEPQA